MSSGNWTHAICERCWIDGRHLGEAAVGTAVTQPVQTAWEHREVEVCCYCFQPTIMGIYVRGNPAETPGQKAARIAEDRRRRQEAAEAARKDREARPVSIYDPSPGGS